MQSVITTNIRCAGCGSNIKYATMNYLMPCGVFNWRLEVWCPECGEVTDAKVRGLVNMHRHQNAYLDAALGVEGHALLETYLNEYEPEHNDRKQAAG